MPNYVHAVTADNATDFLADAYPKALLFTDKDAVSPLFKSLAVHLRGRMRLGQAQSSDSKLADMFGVTSFPKLVAVPGTDASAAVCWERFGGRGWFRLGVCVCELCLQRLSLSLSRSLSLSLFFSLSRIAALQHILSLQAVPSVHVPFFVCICHQCTCLSSCASKCVCCFV